MRTFRRSIQEAIETNGDPFLSFLEPETIVINGEDNMTSPVDIDDDDLPQIPVSMSGPMSAIPLTKEVEDKGDDKEEGKEKKKKGTYSYLSDEQFCNLMAITDAASKSDLFPAEIRQELTKFYIDLVKEKAERESDED